MEYLGTRELASYLGVKMETLAQWRSDGLPPEYSKINGKILYSKSDVDEFLEAHKYKKTDEHRVIGRK